MSRLLSFLLLAVFFSLTGCGQIGQNPSVGSQTVAMPVESITIQPTAKLPPKLVALDTPGPTQEFVLEITSTPLPPQKSQNQVWFINKRDRTVVQIDPQSNQVLLTLQMSGQPVALAAGEGAVWVLVQIDEFRSNVVRIDPLTNQVILNIPITYGSGMSITTGGGAVWVGIADPVAITQLPEGIDYNQTGGVVRINALDNIITDYIKAGAVAVDLVYNPEKNVLWILERGMMYSYLDKIVVSENKYKLLTVSEASGEEGFNYQFSHIALNEAGIWATPLEDNSRLIYRLSPENGRVTASIEVGLADTDNPVDVAASSDSVWVALRSGSVTRVDPNTQKAMEQIPLGGNLSDLFLASESLWGLSRQDGLLYQVNPQNGKLFPPLVISSIPFSTPTVTPTSVPTPGSAGGAWVPCAGAYTSNLQSGMKAIVNPGTPLSYRLYAASGRQQNIIGSLEEREVVSIVDGPSCADGWVWWRVIDAEKDIDGWASEGDGASYWLTPLP